MADLDALREHLRAAGDVAVELDFAVIEQLTGAALPPAARELRDWWSNAGDLRHPQSRAWLSAGRRVERVDVVAGRVRFGAPGERRAAPPVTPAAPAAPAAPGPSEPATAPEPAPPAAGGPSWQPAGPLGCQAPPPTPRPEPAEPFPPPGVAAGPARPPAPPLAYPAPPPASLVPAPAALATWGQRVGSMLLDYLLFAVPSVIFDVVATDVWGKERLIELGGQAIRHKVLTGTAATVGYVVLGVLQLLYFAALNGSRRGQTIGNRAPGIAVRDARTLGPIGFRRAALRAFVRIVLYLCLILPGLINDLSPLWDARRQTIADKVARTVVVKL